MGEEKLEEQAAPDAPLSRTATLDNNPYFDSAKKTRTLPPWLDHWNSRDLKIWFKCSMAAWIYTLFLFINPTLRVIGQATFFGILVMFMVPPSGVVFTGLMAGITIILGACLGWAWGTIAMKAALATRPAADLQRQYAKLQQAHSGNTTNSQQASGQATYTQIAIYNGAMLDPRVSITYFCMIGLFIYLVARIRVAAPKLTLVSIFAMIISDIYLTVAPLIPTFQGTIPRTLILPAGIAIGVSFVCNVLFFPRSTSHLVLDGMQDVLKPMNPFLDACLLNFRNPDNHMEMERLKETKTVVIRKFKELQGNMGFLALDASVGRWGVDDVKSLNEPMRRVLVMFVSLVQVQIARREYKLRDENLQKMVNFFEIERPGQELQLKKTRTKAGTQHMARIYDFRQRSKHSDSEVLLNESIKALDHSGRDLVNCVQEALAAIINSMRLSNSKRWFGRLTVQQCEEICAKHTAVLTKLQQHRLHFPERLAKDLWTSHQHMFGKDGKLIITENDFPPPMGGVMLSLVIEERMVNFATALEDLLTKLVALEAKRTHVRIWLPGNLQNLLPWALEKDVSANDMSTGSALVKSITIDDESQALSMESKEEKKKKKKKDKHAIEDPNTAAAQLRRMQVRGIKKRSFTGRVIIGLYHWLTSTEGFYALRILVVTIALGVPAAIPSSAGFYYQEKGLWGLIMAQTALLPYAADFIFSFFLRMAGTILGACCGLVMWYIGAGNGPGNPYGMAAIAAPFVLVFMWLRLFTSPAFLQGTLLLTVTTYLVMAYSWVDTHIPSYGNPGVGYSVFWRRMLLVIIGFAAAAIVTFIPRPPSASRHHRRLMAESLQTIKNQYALFTMNMHHLTPDLKEVTEKTAIDVSDVLLEIEPQIRLISLEFSSSNFDAKTLSLICHMCMNLNQNVAQLLIYATELPEDQKASFLRITGATEEGLVADIMAVITLVQQSLRTGDPLPAVLPVPLMVRALENAVQRTRGDDHIMTLNEEKLTQSATRQYCSAMTAFVQFLSNLDETVIMLKRAVGETTWVDLEGRLERVATGESSASTSH